MRPVGPYALCGANPPRPQPSHASPWCSPWLQAGEIVEKALLHWCQWLHWCQCSKSSWPCHAPCNHAASGRNVDQLMPLHSPPVLFHGALLGCKLGRLWRMPWSKGAKPQRAHGLAMHHAIMPSHEELWTSAPCRGRGEDAGGWLRTRRKGPLALLNNTL